MAILGARFSDQFSPCTQTPEWRSYKFGFLGANMFDDCTTFNDQWVRPPFVDARFAPLCATRDQVASGAFHYRGATFMYTVHRTASEGFQPRVIYRYGIRDIEQFVLPHDMQPSATEADACRHAELQAVGWWHDRIGASEAALVW